MTRIESFMTRIESFIIMTGSIHAHDRDRLTLWRGGGGGATAKVACQFTLFHLQKYVTNPLRKVRIFSKGRNQRFGAAPAGGDSPPPPRYCVNPNAAGAKMISFKSFTFTRGTRSPKGNCQILLVLELEGVKDSRNRSKIEEEKTLSGKKSR